jgi:hypothetical protein
MGYFVQFQAAFALDIQKHIAGCQKVYCEERVIRPILAKLQQCVQIAAEWDCLLGEYSSWCSTGEQLK